MVVQTDGPAYQTFHGSRQLIVPTFNFKGEVVASKTVHATFRPDLSMGRSIWQTRDGTLYHVVDKEALLN